MPQSDIKPALERISANIFRYREYYDYYDGKHALNFASEKFKNKFGRRLQKLRENLCKIVVKAPADRLEIIGFQTDGQDIAKKAWDFWKKSKMPLHSGSINREAFKCGDAYAIVWKDRLGKTRIYPQLAANVTVWRNAETDEIEKAAKCWQGADGFYYLTLYYPDSIEKYVTRGKCQSFPTDVKYFDVRHIQGENFPLVNPYGKVPVFHFKYDADIQEFGNSILTDVIPLNDAVNKAWADIFAAQEENTRRRRWAAGLQVEVDEETGKKINPYKPDDDLWIADDHEAKFGEFSDVELEQMLKVLETAVKSIAIVSGIPPAHFNLESVGNAISGEALRKIEARFIAIIQDAQRSYGESYGEMVSFMLSMETTANDGLEIETQWTDAAPMSETELLDNALKKKNLGWSIEQIQRDMGLSDEQIAKMLGENNSRADADMERQQKAFDAGNSLVE